MVVDQHARGVVGRCVSVLTRGLLRRRSLRSVSRAAGAWQHQPYLGALARRAAHGRLATVAAHPVVHRPAQAQPFGRDGVGVEAAATVAHEHLDLGALDLGVDVDPVGAGVPGGVEHRLAGGAYERVDVAVERGVGRPRPPRPARRAPPRPRRRRRRAGRRRSAGSPSGASVPHWSPNSQARSSRSCLRARVATRRSSPAWRCSRASVCSTESCRCAATSARSCARTRSDRSAPSSRTSRTTHGPSSRATPASASTSAITTSSSSDHPADCATSTDTAATTRALPSDEPGDRPAAVGAEHQPEHAAARATGRPSGPAAPGRPATTPAPPRPRRSAAGTTRCPIDAGVRGRASPRPARATTSATAWPPSPGPTCRPPRGAAGRRPAALPDGRFESRGGVAGSSGQTCCGSSRHSSAYASTPAPPRPTPTTSAIRTASTLTPRCSARPAATPASIRPSSGRAARRYVTPGRGAGPAGGAADVVTPRCSHTRGRRGPSAATLRLPPACARGLLRCRPGSTPMVARPGRRPRWPAWKRRLQVPMAGTASTPAPSRASIPRLRTVLELRRPVDDRMVAGVCTGLARYLRLDPVVVRVLLATLAVVGGLGLILYGTVWLLTPEEGSDRAPLGRVDDLAPGGTRTVVLLVAGLLAVAAIVGPGVLWWGPWPVLVVVGLVAWLLLRDRGRGGDVSAAAAAASPGRRPRHRARHRPTAPTSTVATHDRAPPRRRPRPRRRPLPARRPRCRCRARPAPRRPTAASGRTGRRPSVAAPHRRDGGARTAAG